MPVTAENKFFFALACILQLPMYATMMVGGTELFREGEIRFLLLGFALLGLIFWLAIKATQSGRPQPQVAKVS
ncbi:MAG: hypothetical protein WD153_02905 [Candidatus Paceibacterota bacterium]